MSSGAVSGAISAGFGASLAHFGRLLRTEVLTGASLISLDPMYSMSRCSLPYIKGFRAELLEPTFKLRVALVYLSEITRPQREPKQPKNCSTSIPVVCSRSELLGINTLPSPWIFLLLFKVRNIPASNCFAGNTLQTFIVYSPPHSLYSYLGRSLALTS